MPRESCAQVTITQYFSICIRVQYTRVQCRTSYFTTIRNKNVLYLFKVHSGSTESYCTTHECFLSTSITTTTTRHNRAKVYMWPYRTHIDQHEQIQANSNRYRNRPTTTHGTLCIPSLCIVMFMCTFIIIHSLPTNRFGTPNIVV